MLATALRGVFWFVIPGGVLAAAVIAVVENGALLPWLPFLQWFYPAAIFAAALLLGWRFDRSRLVFATVMIILAERALAIYGLRGDYVSRIVIDAVAVLLPLNLALLMLLRERGIFTRHGLLRWGVIAVQPLAIALLLEQKRFDWLGIFDALLFTGPALHGLPLQQPALVAFAVAGLVMTVSLIRRRDHLEIGLFWVLALIFVAFLTTGPGPLMSIYLASAVLILVVVVIEMSHALAFKDDLTGLPARRALNQALLKLGSRYTVAMLDIDHFKKFNDRYGHDVGDQVLQMVAAKLARVSGGGKAYRYGGEEFTVLFPGKSVSDVLPHLETLRRTVELADFGIRGKDRPRQKPAGNRKKPSASEQRVKITVSIGVAQPESRGMKPVAVIKCADQALYRAKADGRNRVAS